MAFPRAAALRSCFRGVNARATIARPQLGRQIARRGYASGGHGSAKAGGDALWAAGAVAVTVPSIWYLVANGPDLSHSNHGDHGDNHGKSHDEEHEEESKDEGEAEDTEDKGDDGEKSEESDSDEEKQDADTPDTSDDEGKGDGKNTVKSIPDAKGGSKKRLESNKGVKAGEAQDSGDDVSHDKAAASKSAGGKNSQSGKQEGLSNTDTKHSTDITNDPNKSKKGEGGPDTAKLKGTVDPNRPQPENKKK